jgi:vitamin B12 transporter
MTEGIFMNLSKPILLSLAIASCFSSPLLASDTNLDQIIVSATRVEQSKQDYTGNVTVITSEQLQEKAIQTLPEALDRLAGIPVYSNGGLGTSTSVFLRGHDSKRVLLVVDGMRFNDPSSTGGAQWQHLLVSDIERIEIIEGAQAGIWGADAAAGVINVITKTAAQGTHGSLAYTLGDLGQKQTQGSVSYANKQFDARVGYTGLSSDEFSAITPIVNGVKQNPLAYEKDGYRNDTVNAKLGWNIAKDQRLELSAFKADARGNYDGSSANSINYLTYQQQTLGASYRFALADWQMTVNAQDGSIDRDFNGSLFNAKTNQQGITASRNDSLGNWAFGADVSEQSSDKMSNASIDRKQTQRGVFVARTQKFYLPQAEQPTIVNLSLRNDDFNDYSSYIGKRIGLKQMLTKDAYFAMNMADSRRMPNLFERFIQYDAAYNATVRSDVGSLRPETIDSKEMSLGWKGYSVTRFEDKVNDLIDYDFANRNYYNRLGESQLNGWQWNASESMPSIASEVSLNYLVLDAKAQTGIPLARRPDTSSSINWTYLGLNKTVLALQTQFVGTRIDSYSSTGKAGPDTGNYWLWHANASYQWNKEVRIFVKGVNLTDERIAQATDSYNASAPTTYYAYSPRTVLAGVEYKF